MKVIIAGASGFLGHALIRDLTDRGHEITTLVRRPSKTPTEVSWDPEQGELDPAALADHNVVVSLSGVGIGDKRWTPEYRRLLVDSRVQPTRTIAAALAALPVESRPATWLSASAVGYYGERGDQPLPETATAGTGFLAGLVVEWEAATQAAVDAGVRVATMRTGLVLARSGGLLTRLIPLFNVGLGGKLGSGKQYQAWISLADEIGAIRHIIETPTISGPVNLAGPDPVRNDEFTKQLGAALKRPTIFPTPAFGIRLVIGQFADEGVLVSQRAIPEVLTTTGYQFEHPTLRAALAWALDN